MIIKKIIMILFLYKLDNLILFIKDCNQNKLVNINEINLKIVEYNLYYKKDFIKNFNNNKILIVKNSELFMILLFIKQNEIDFIKKNVYKKDEIEKLIIKNFNKFKSNEIKFLIKRLIIINSKNILIYLNMIIF